MTHETFLTNVSPQPSPMHQGQQFRGFAEFLAWVQQHWHDASALQHAMAVVHPFVMQGLQGDVQTWRNAPWVWPEAGLPGQPPQGTNMLRWLYADGATSLLDASPAGAQNNLTGLTELDGPTAQVLARHPGPLNLSGVRALSFDASSALAEHGGLLLLDGLAPREDGSLGGIIAPLVERRAAERGKAQPGLSLCSLKNITEEDGDLLSRVQGPLMLNGLSTLDARQATLLAQRKGDPGKPLGTLHLDGWRNPSAEALQALASYGGPLSLGAWVPAAEGAPEQWQALAGARFQSLALPAITSLSLPNLQALAALSVKRLYLPGITVLTDDLVETLGTMQLLRLALDGVQNATDRHIRQLVDLQNTDTSGLSMASLELTPQLQAELTRHQKLLEPLFSRVYPP